MSRGNISKKSVRNNKRTSKSNNNRNKVRKNVVISASGPNSCLMFIGKYKYRALVDSGAEICLMHERVFKSLKDRPKLKKTSINLQTASHDCLDILGCIDLNIRVGGTDMRQEFCVFKGLNRNLILGFDWLKHTDVILYFDLQCLRIHGKTYFRLEEDIHIVSTIRIKRTEIIKPNTIKICYGKFRKQPDLMTWDLFEISEIDKDFMVNEPGLQVMHSVTKLSKDRTVPLLIVTSFRKFIDMV